MKNLKNWSPILKVIKKEFEGLFDLSIKPLEYGPKELSDWYTNSFNTIIQGAIDFRNNLPFETTTLLCELIRSDYALKFIAGSKTILKSSKSAWSVYEKVRFVRDSYESIYQNFAFISFSINYKTEGISNLRSDWFYPYSAKDKIKKGNDNWIIGTEKLTGKKYILQKSKLFDWLTPNQKALLEDIRNSDSHYKTIIIDESIFLLDGSNSQEITEEVEFLYEYLMACHKIMYEIYFHLLFYHQFWILPSVLLTLSDEFSYNKREVAYNLLQSVFDRIKKKEDENKEKNTKLGDSPKKLFLFFGGVIHYALIGIWDVLEKNNDLIDCLLQPIGKQISLEKMRGLQKEAVIEILNIFRISSAKIEQFIDKREKAVYKELEIQDYDEIDLLNEIDSYIISLKKALKAKDHNSIILFTIFPSSMAFIIPLGKLHNSFKSIFSPI